MSHVTYIRVRDTRTRHEFDVPDTDPRIGSVFQPVRKSIYPPSSLPRPAKHYPAYLRRQHHGR